MLSYSPAHARDPFPDMHCPYCQSKDIWRLQPLPWMMRVRPHFKNRRCSNCGHEFAVWMGVFSLKHKTGHKIAFLYLVLLAVLAVLAASDLYRWKTHPDTSCLRSGYNAVRALFESQLDRPARPAASPDAPPSDMTKF